MAGDEELVALCPSKEGYAEATPLEEAADPVEEVCGGYAAAGAAAVVVLGLDVPQDLLALFHNISLLMPCDDCWFCS